MKLFDTKPFTEVEHPAFREKIKYVNPAAEALLTSSGDTIRHHIVKIYQEEIKTVTGVISKARSRIHLSFDIWSSPNGKAYLGIEAYWMAKRMQPMHALLGFKPLTSTHTGQNIGDIVFDLAKSFGILSKLGYCVLDNAPNNDTAIARIGDKLTEFIGAGHFDAKDRWVRCFAHILNIIMKAFLIETKATTALELAAEAALGNLDEWDELLQEDMSDSSQGPVHHL